VFAVTSNVVKNFITEKHYIEYKYFVNKTVDYNYKIERPA